MSTACLPVRCSGVTRPICQSQRIGWWSRARCGGYQQLPGRAWQASGAGSGTTCQRKPARWPRPGWRCAPRPGAGRRRAARCRTRGWPGIAPPPAAVDPVPLGRPPVSRIRMRNAHLEVLLGRAGAPFRGAVDERRHGRSMPRVGPDRRGGQPADRAPDDLEAERGRLRLHHLGRGLGDPEPPPGVRGARPGSAGRRTAWRCVSGGGHAVLPARRGSSATSRRPRS